MFKNSSCSRLDDGSRERTHNEGRGGFGPAVTGKRRLLRGLESACRLTHYLNSFCAKW